MEPSGKEFEAAIFDAALRAPCECCDQIIAAGQPVDQWEVPPSCRVRLALLGLLKRNLE